MEFRYVVSAPGIPPIGEETFRLKILAEDNKKPVLKVYQCLLLFFFMCDRYFKTYRPFSFIHKLAKQLEVHRDGELILDGEILNLFDEDTYLDHLILKVLKGPKYGSIFEVIQQQPVFNTTEVDNSTTTATSPSNSRRKIEEGEEVPASLISQGRLR